MLRKGDTVWYINTCWTSESVGAKYVARGTVISINNLNFILEPFKICAIRDIGKHVFLTPEAAEMKLKETIKKE